MAQHEERVLCFWTALRDGRRFLLYWLPDAEVLGATDLLDAVYEVTMDKRGRQRLLKNLAVDMVESKWRRTFSEKGFRLDYDSDDGGSAGEGDRASSLCVRYVGQSAQLTELADRDRRQKRNADLVSRLMEERDLLMAQAGRNGAAEGTTKALDSKPDGSPETVAVTAAPVSSLQTKRRKSGKATGVVFDDDDENAQVPAAKTGEEAVSESKVAQRRKTASMGSSLSALKSTTPSRQRSAASSTQPSRSSSPMPPSNKTSVVSRRSQPSLSTTSCVTNKNAESHFPAPPSCYPAPPVTNQPLMIFFTFSGTSLFPRPVGVPAQALIRNLLQITHAMYAPAAVGDRVLLPISIHHLFGALSAYAALLGGATVYTMPKYSMRGLIAGVHELKVTRLHLTTNMAQVLMTNGSLKKLSQSLRSVVLGGARFDSSVAKLCKEHSDTVKFQQMYINTEVGGCVAVSPAISDAVDNVGWPLPGTVLRVSAFEDTQLLCRPHQLGQLLCAGPQVAPLFFRNSKVNTAETALVDGRFARTGDVGHYDERGAIYVLDRQSDIIRYRGTLICPSEVESALRTHPGVADCAVVGRSANIYSGASTTGELPAAFIVRATNYLHLSSAEIKHHIGGQMKQVGQFPGGVYFVAEIPRSVGGRIYRRHLKQFCDRERLAGQQGSQDSIAAAAPPVTAPSPQSANNTNQPPAIARLNGVTVRRAEMHRTMELRRRVTAGSMSSSASLTKSLKSPKEGSSSSQLSLLSNNNDGAGNGNDNGGTGNGNNDDTRDDSVKSRSSFQ